MKKNRNKTKEDLDREQKRLTDILYKAHNAELKAGEKLEKFLLRKLQIEAEQYRRENPNKKLSPWQDRFLLEKEARENVNRRSDWKLNGHFWYEEEVKKEKNNICQWHVKHEKRMQELLAEEKRREERRLRVMEEAGESLYHD